MPGKRKSESAVPIGKSKLRKTVNADDSNSERDDDSSDKLFVEEKPVAAGHVKKSKSRKSEPARLIRAEEYEEDEGRMESQQFLALVEFESKKKRLAVKAAGQYMDQFAQQLEDGEKTLKKQLQDLRAAAPKHDETFLENFSEAFAASRPHADDPRQGKNASGRSFVAMYKQSKNLAAAGKDILEKFALASQLTVAMEVTGLLENDWGTEDEEALKVLGIGCDVGMQKYQSRLSTSAPVEFDEEVSTIANMIYKGNDDQFSNAWAVIAKRQEKSAKKIMKTLSLTTAV